MGELWEAAKNGELGTVKRLVESGANIEEPSSNRLTPLMWAVQKSRFDVAEYLLEHGAKVDAKSKRDLTPLTWAVMNSPNLSIIRLLLENGADVNVKCDTDVRGVSGNTPLLRATHGARVDRARFGKVKLLIEYGANVNAKNEDGFTPLLEALDWSNTDLSIIKLLLENGADVSEKTNNGYSSLMAAAWYGNLDIVKFLVEKGLDVSAKDNDGYTPFLWAARGGSLDVVKFFIEKGSDINEKTEDGDTALMAAADCGSLDVVRFLLENGADVNAKTKNGETALLLATWGRNLDVVKFLIENGADVNARDNDGWTVLMAAVRIKYLDLELVKFLVEKGLDVNAKNNDGNTPLILLVSREEDDGTDEYSDIAKFLLEKGAEINARDDDGKTPLLLVAEKENWEVAKLLIERGADVNARSNEGNTALIWAAWAGELNTVKLLVEHGAKLDPKDNEGKTALMWAEENEHHDVAKYLREQGDGTAEKDTERRCWWVTASTWKFSDFPIGGVQTYMLLSPDGRQHRFKKNYLEAKVGDLVIGYESFPTRQIVALCEISAAINSDEPESKQNIQFKKTEDLAHPVDFATLKGVPGLSNMEFLRANGQGSFFKVTKEECAILMELMRKPGTVPTPTPMKTNNKEHVYWWLNANPNKWSFSEIPVGGVQHFTLLNENGSKRRVHENFLNAKVGDKVIGYLSTPTKQIVALCEISAAQDGEKIQIRKTENLVSPIDYASLKDAPELKNMEFFKQGGRGTLFKLTKEEGEYIMDEIRELNPEPVPLPVVEKYGKADFLEEVFMSAQRYDVLKYLLETKKNVILKGVPGVGKTFAAKRLAWSMMGEKDDSRVEFVQFHQNYSYEDFMMGYKPSENEFKLELGIFYRFCQKAANQPNKDFFFIIDEINRGNPSKIFGELLMLIESDHRGEKTTLAYNGLPFSVPENLYIIGMMNTADRSLAMIDYALRRRFGFFEMEPAFDSEGFKKYQRKLSNSTFDDLIDEVKKLNKKITADKSLGKNFCIGHSYFCGWQTCTEGKMRAVVNCEILPLLEEYFFDDDKKLEDLSETLRTMFPNK